MQVERIEALAGNLKRREKFRPVAIPRATECLLIEIVGLRKIGENYAETGFDCVAIFGGTQTRKTLLRGTMVCRIRETQRWTSIHPAKLSLSIPARFHSSPQGR